MPRARRAAPAPAPAAAPDALAPYRARRDFAATPEPAGRAAPRRRAAAKAAPAARFVVQKHAARRLHYDLRLELDGVLVSFAVTRGPSLVPGEKRLAVRTEDHPLEYLDFEGVIPQGSYGGGAMIVWDRGTWSPEGDPREGLARGKLVFALAGERLRGRFHLVRTGGARAAAKGGKENWLLLKSRDEHARAPGDPDPLAQETASLVSGLTVEALLAGETAPAKPARRSEAATAASPAADVPGAVPGPLPAFAPPCLATLVETPPGGGAWIHEIKFDGYRLQARLCDGRVKLLTRNGHDWTDRFAPLARALAGIGARAALIDGEAVVEDERGVSDFAGLQAALKPGASERVVYQAFDLLHLDGLDLAGAPLRERKRLLALLLDDLPAGGAVRLSEHIEADGPGMLRHACRIGLEGIVSKRADRQHVSGRSDVWRKAKCVARQEYVVAGYAPATSRPKAVGSLVLGAYEGDALVHVGRVGTGFTAEAAEALRAALEARAAPAAPFAARLPREAGKGVRWARPELVAEIEHRGLTGDGLLRHASFKGLREDKDPREVVRETPPAGGTAMEDEEPAAPGVVAGLALTHPDRVLWEGQGVTKQGLAELYAAIADWALPHMAHRPLALVRCPTGARKTCFFAKHPFAGLDEAVIRGRAGDDEVLAVADLRGLVALVQSGVLEIHPWGCRLEDPERPDRLVFDLDPGEGTGYREVVEAAAEVRERLAALKLESFLKTTGGKGLHVVVPLSPEAGWEEAKAFAAGIAAAMARDAPARYTDALAKKARVGRIFVDYLRNGRGATAVAAYSTRAREGAPISTPLAWEELSEAIRPDHFAVMNLPTRLAHLSRDPWAEIGRVRQRLPR